MSPGERGEREMTWQITRGAVPPGPGWEPFAVDDGAVMWRKRQSDPKPGTLATPREVADLLRIDVGTLRRWMRSGAVPAPLRVGRVLRWDRDELARLIARKPPTP